jgi:hypothetical protein
MKSRRNQFVTTYELRWWGCAAVVLCAVTGLRLTAYRAPEPEAYLRHVAEVAETMPPSFGSWVSVEAPIPSAAVTMLLPNIAFSRRYTNLATGQQATLLLVQCRDARDLLGHYPPVCYVSSGFRKAASASKDWLIEGLAIEGMVYTFTSANPQNPTAMIIYDFMILPNGHTCRDMQGVNATARDPRRRHLGAAQLQILVDPALSEQDREALFITLVKANHKIIDVLLAGDKP